MDNTLYPIGLWLKVHVMFSTSGSIARLADTSILYYYKVGLQLILVIFHVFSIYKYKKCTDMGFFFFSV